VDSDLRVLERAAPTDDQARLRFFAAAARSEDPNLASIIKIQDRVYTAAMLALAVVERGGIDPESSRFYDGGVIPSTLSVTEDDCVRALARCVRGLTGAAAWSVFMLRELSPGSFDGKHPFAAAVLAGKSEDGHVGLAIRSKGISTAFSSWTWASVRPGLMPIPSPLTDLSFFVASLEALSFFFSIHVLPSREDFNAARSAMRRAGGGPLVRPRVPSPTEAISTWAEYAPERRGREAWIDGPDVMSPTYANGTRPIVIAPEADVRRWAALWA
jgi:hypothetical protein